MLKKVKSKNVDVFEGMVFLLGFFIILLLGTILFNNFLILNENKIYVSATISEKVGFDLNITALTFGNVIVENSASRKINIQNKMNRKVKIKINSRGEISEYLFVSENNFILNPGEKKGIDFLIFFPEETKMKKYEGVIKIISRRL
tara:strand:- start:217 stop:654 length:438 start_codon:yes stop_codon:yes gene_type:complete